MTIQPRRTQQERRNQTRAKLLDATIACLIEEGYHAITTTKVCSRSGMSQGAIFKHYPTKNALVVAAIEKLYGQLIETYEALVLEPSFHSDHISICLQALWKLYELPELMAVFDLHIAARTDPELRNALEPLERVHRLQIRQTAARIFPHLAENPQFQTGIEIILMVVQGASIGNLVLTEPVVQHHRQQALETIARLFMEIANG